MKTLKINSLFIILGLIGLNYLQSSCSRYYYQPNAVNAPMMKEKGDLKIGISGTTSSGDLNGTNTSSSILNLQTAYSPIQYLGLMVNYSNYNYSFGEEDPSKGDVDANAGLFEGGVGGYYPIINRESGFGLIADTYVGYGGGKLSSDVNMNFNRLFIQPGINVTFPYFDIGLATRISGIKYSNFDAHGMSPEYISQQGLTEITQKRHYFFEPALTLRAGYKFIKAELQVVGSTPMNELDWESNGTVVTFGIHFSLMDAIKFGKSKGF